MTKKILFIIISLFCCSVFIYGQNNSVINNSENSVKVWRTSNNADALISFSVDKFTIAPNTTRYIQMMVNYKAQPDIALQVANEKENSETIISTLIRPLEKYTNFNTWQTIVFPIIAQENEIEVNNILIFPDLGFENEPTGFILNDFGEVGYIDEIVLLEGVTLSSSAENFKNNVISIQPNPVENMLKISTEKTLKEVYFYNFLGNQITKNINRITIKEYDLSSLSTGLYLIKCIDENNIIETLKIIKQ
ncbi:T9SS type A sorting domain-containing protein [uncultured Polaribacter sp.]|uniref:T9SS type A sorting domain-containing protein n=1 Tax=uncultured Polaribacter sp. TaxID=174711 RepID=UPI0026071593|nr:T9SS type A sorting domain-containing protein [uncultured Polaribacter sp.]